MGIEFEIAYGEFKERLEARASTTDWVFEALEKMYQAGRLAGVRPSSDAGLRDAMALSILPSVIPSPMPAEYTLGNVNSWHVKAYLMADSMLNVRRRSHDELVAMVSPPVVEGTE